MKKKIILSTLLAINISFADDSISNLLSEYEEVADLSNKTKIESLGSYKIFTRRDLEIMQAYKLSDVLKSLPLHTFVPNSFGVFQLTSFGSLVGLNTSYRLFINDHEVSSINTDNPFLIYDEYPLDNIDHIEIYLNSGAVKIGNEPFLLVIKMYTKEPQRENATILSSHISTNQEYSLSFNTSKKIDDNKSYFLSITKSYNNFKTQYFNGSPIERDSNRLYGFFQYRYYDTTIDLSFSSVKRDAFTNYSPDKQPSISNTTSIDFYINATQYFLEDKSLKLNISLDINKRKAEFENDLAGGGLFIPPIYLPPNIPIYYYEKRTLNKYTFHLLKDFKTEKNTLSLGFSYKKKENNLNDSLYKTPTNEGNMNSVFVFKDTDIYTGYLENQYSINDKNLLILSLKYDYYKRDGGLKDFGDYLTRFGYVSYITKDLYIKGFLARGYIPPSFFEYEFSQNPKSIKREIFKGFMLDINYKKDRNRFKLNYDYLVTDDIITFGENGYYNYPERMKFHILDFEYKFDINPSQNINFDIYKTFSNSSKMSPTFGWNIRYTGSINKFDIFGELIYREGFAFENKEVKNSYNLNSGIIYNYSPSLAIKLKGENLLNSSPKSVFPLTPKSDTGIFSSYDRKIIFTIEKVF